MNKKNIKIILIIFTVLFLNTCDLFLPERVNEESISSVPYSYNITSNGGVIEVDDPSSELQGFKLSIEEDTFSTEVKIEISKGIIPDISLEIGSVVYDIKTIENDEILKPIKITLPITSIFTDPVIITYDENTGFIDYLPVIETSNNIVSYTTPHFSSHAYFKWQYSEEPHDTGFVFGEDTLPFRNFAGSDPDGTCFGMVLFTNWYYRYHNGQIADSILNEAFLKSIVDEIQVSVFDIEFMCAMFATVIMNGLDLNAYDNHTYKSLLKTLADGELGVVVLIDNEGEGNHAILVFGWDGEKFLVYNPNSPDFEEYLYFDKDTRTFNNIKEFGSTYDMAVLYREVEYSTLSDVRRIYEYWMDKTICGTWIPFDDSLRKEIIFRVDETYTIFYQDGHVINGTYSYTDTEITFVYTYNSTENTETYSYSLENDTGIIYNLYGESAVYFSKV